MADIDPILTEEDSVLFRDRRQLEHHALTQIRKHSLDPYNRIHSILEDIEFVESIHKNYPSYPVLANLRCGAWYCDPRKVNGVTAHFKSMDGHYNGWSFNLRRPNLHVLPLIVENNGIILVDSTRSGKRMPDSFSKTTPIWCAVINRALKLRNLVIDDNWDTTFYTPPQSVSKQEHVQIEEKLDAWAENLASSSYDLPRICKPLRTVWITPASSSLPLFNDSTPFTPVICLTASKLIEEGLDRRREGYVYVQGAGDDHEYWSKGLSPTAFWENKGELLSATEDFFSDILEKVVNKSLTDTPPNNACGEGNECSDSGQWRGWKRIPTTVSRASGLIFISSISDMPVSLQITRPGEDMKESLSCPCIILRKASDLGTSSNVDITERHTSGASGSSFLEINLPTDKKRSEYSFKASLSRCVKFAHEHLIAGENLCISCPTGSDLSVGVALVILQTYFDEDGKLNAQKTKSTPIVSKDTLRTRLHWIIASRPEANPSRATLKRVNEYFLSPKA